MIRFARGFVAVIACLSLAVPARASEGSGNSSQQSGNSSEGSGNSSEASGGSSDSSADSSEGTGQTGEASNKSADSSNQSGESSEKSSGDSSGGSSKGSGKSSESSGQVSAVVSVIMLVGASTYAGWLFAMTTVRRQMQANAELERFLKDNHALVTRDVLAGSGPLLDGWYASLGLNAAERAQMARAFDRTGAQTALLAALDDVNLEKARAFAEAFAKALDLALGRARYETLVKAHAT